MTRRRSGIALARAQANARASTIKAQQNREDATRPVHPVGALEEAQRQTSGPRPAIDLLCALRFECRDWAEALCGERDGLDELLGEIDSTIAASADRDGYICSACKGEVPHDSNTCPHCGTVDERPFE